MEIKTMYQEDANWDQAAEMIQQQEWSAAQFLAKRMQERQLKDWEGVIIATENNQLAGFTSFVEKDILKEGDYTPFIATVYVNPDFRGRFLAKSLVAQAEHALIKAGYKTVFLVTSLENFYEKMGYHLIKPVQDIFDRPMKLYQKSLT